MKTIFNFIECTPEENISFVDSLPREVKRVLNNIDNDLPYNKLEQARRLIIPFGYDFDYYLDGNITEFYKL